MYIHQPNTKMSNYLKCVTTCGLSNKRIIPRLHFDPDTHAGNWCCGPKSFVTCCDVHRPTSDEWPERVLSFTLLLSFSPSFFHIFLSWSPTWLQVLEISRRWESVVIATSSTHTHEHTQGKGNLSSIRLILTYDNTLSANKLFWRIRWW